MELEQLQADLNPQQLAAVTHGGGPCLVLAGAGSGKTRVITYRIAWLIGQGVPATAICGVTFTNRAASQMRNRVGTLLGSEPDGLWLLTFHALGLRLLRDASGGTGAPRIGFAVYDRADSMAVWRDCQKKLNIDSREFRPRGLFETCSRGINRLEDPRSWDEAGRPSEQRYAGRVYDAYRTAMDRRNALDFDDLLAWPLRLLASGAAIADPRRFQHFLVDEYQDTNRLQYRLIRALLGEQSAIMVVGDEDQSIYRWRGADIANVLDFERDFPGSTTVRLEQNYRSTRPILAAANSLVAHNHERLGKELWTELPGDTKPRLTYCSTERSEAVWISKLIAQGVAAGTALTDMAILYRTNAQSRPFEEELAGRKLAFRVIGGPTFFRRSEVKDLLAYLRVVQLDDDDALARVCALPPRGLGPATIAKLAEGRESVMSLIREAGEQSDPEAFLVARGTPPRAAAGAASLAALLHKLAERIDRISLGDLLEALLRDSGYRTWLNSQQDGADRLANLDELIASAYEFGGEDTAAESFEAYLDRAALVADADSSKGSRGGVHLTTIHAAKGLEFDTVFVVGLEEGLFPHASALDEGHLEEERRLAYVAMTRARKNLFLSAARTRRIQGRERIQLASRFMGEIDPRHLVVDEEPGAVAAAARGSMARSRSASSRSYEPRVGRRPATPRAAARKVARPVDPHARGTGVPANLSSLSEGTAVFHPMFGAGRVVQTQGSGDRLKITVSFARAGTKHLIAKFAKLELLAT
ncbi:MAG: AAA family ATPase [Acidobacteria bacterium]|nr:AAA family ATPase [Acidobacteriota bacterium]